MVLALPLIAVLATGCLNNKLENRAADPAYFDFATSKIHTLQVSYNLGPDGDLHFEVYNLDPEVNPDVRPIFAANTIGGTFEGDAKIPSYTQKLYFTTDAEGVQSRFVVDYNPNVQTIVANISPSVVKAAITRSMRAPGPYSIGYSGLVAFEDNWPSKGDYDMNDVVIRYNCTVFHTSDNMVDSMIHEFTPIRKGAALRNGFGYEILGQGLTKASAYEYFYKSVKVEVLDMNGNPVAQAPANRYPKTAKGFEDGQTTPVIMLFEDVNDNVVGGPWAEYADGEQFPILTYRVTLVMKEPHETKLFGFPPYNPFIVVAAPGVYTDGGPRGREVHLPNHRPTTKAYYQGGTLFGTKEDKSDPERNLWYVSDQKFPFAIDIPNVNLKMPFEDQRIDARYPEFAVWAESEGALQPYWYWTY